MIYEEEDEEKIQLMRWFKGVTVRGWTFMVSDLFLVVWTGKTDYTLRFPNAWADYREREGGKLLFSLFGFRLIVEKCNSYTEVEEINGKT